MKGKVVLSVTILLFLVAILVPEANSKDEKSGTSSLSFLKIGAGARAVGMGEAFTSQSNGVSSPLWNPAAISGTKGTRISFTHVQWFQDITAEHFSSAFRAGENVLGLSISLGKVPDIQRRDAPTTEPLALFDAHDLVAWFSYARWLKDRYAVGLSVKWIYEKIDISSASGLGFDLGGIFSPFADGSNPILEKLTFGAAILNLGSKMKFEEESYSLPTQYKAGVSCFLEKENWQSDFNLSLDLVKPRDDEVKAHLGGEYGLYQSLKLRAGYQLGYDEKDISFGMGIKYKNYSIDYAFLPYQSDLGDVHCISLDLEF